MFALLSILMLVVIIGLIAIFAAVFICPSLDDIWPEDGGGDKWIVRGEVL